MLFEKLSNNIEYKKYPEDEEKVTLHLSLPRQTKENLHELKAVYDDSGIDERKFEISMFVSMVLEEYFKQLPDDLEGLGKVMQQVKVHELRCKA